MDPHEICNVLGTDGVDLMMEESGCTPLKVMVTYCRATQMDQDLGSITPRKCADFVFLQDLQRFQVLRTVIDGQVVAESGRLLTELQPFQYPE